ncbi:MFS transporter [Mitsuokella sp.]|uniref:MFS transporter n=1 Tax=Mitsuokella sp. TaxID=2049034 RepID=UPI003D7CBF5A
MLYSSAGFASMLFASKIGHLSDKIGAQKVLPACLLLTGAVSIPQGLVTSPWQLALLRFIHGVAVAGLMPSINALIRNLTPSFCLGRIYGFNQSAQFIGMFSGAFLGGHLAAVFGIRQMFFIVAVLLLTDAIWCHKIEK